MRFNTLTKTILVFILWIICIYKFYLDYDDEYLMDSLIHNSLIIIACIVSAFAIYADYSEFKQKKKIASFFSSLTAFLCIAGFLLVVYFLNRQDQTPTIFYATRNNSGFGRITIDFRQNNTYKLGIHHFMSTKYKRGNYTIKDSIIYIDKSDDDHIIFNKLILKPNPNYDSIKKSNLLKIFFGTPEEDVKAKTFLYQINQDGFTIDSSISFKVVEKTFN